MLVNWKEAQQKAARTARWAVTMTKVRIRLVASRTRWQLVTFYGKAGAESVGIVDMLAIRKDHRAPLGALRRGDALQIILIRVKGGTAATPTWKDATRLRAVAKRHGACDVLLATWKKGTQAVSFVCAEHLSEMLGPKSPTSIWFFDDGREAYARVVAVEVAGSDLHIALADATGDKQGIVVCEVPAKPQWCDVRKTVFGWTRTRFPLHIRSARKLTLNDRCLTSGREDLNLRPVAAATALP